MLTCDDGNLAIEPRSIGRAGHRADWRKLLPERFHSLPSLFSHDEGGQSRKNERD